MTMNFKYHVIHSVINIVPLCGGKMIELAKEKEKISKNKWEKPAVIPLIPIVGVNNCPYILHVSKLMVHVYTIYKTVHQFAIDYMINPSLHIKKMFRTQVEKCLGCSFSIETMQSIKNYLKKNYTSAMALIMIYETVGIYLKVA